MNCTEANRKYYKNTGIQPDVYLANSVSSQRCCSENNVPTPIVTSNLILMGLTFLALSSFPPFSQSCQSVGQQREGERENMLCQLSRVTSARMLPGSNDNKL